MKKDYLFLCGFIIIILYLIIHSTSSATDLEGEYVLHSDPNCHYLTFDSDTLELKADGTLSSRNFSKDAIYRIKKDYGNKIEITFNGGDESMSLSIESSIFRKTKFRICMDLDAYYIKI